MNHTPEAFPDDHRSVTFVGRPFPLEEAHEHFSRLRRWGLTFCTYLYARFLACLQYSKVRFLVTWEAIEHDGPYVYSLLFAPTYQLNMTVASTTIRI